MTALALLLLLASPASARRTAVSDKTVVATTPNQAAANIETLTARLLAAERAKDAPAYAAARRELLENLAELQDWAERIPDAASITPNLTHTLTPAGRAALGRRKPRASDFVPRPGVVGGPRGGPLDFKP